MLLDLIGDMTQLAKSALWVGRVWLFMIEEMRWRAVGIHDKYKALGISVVVQFLEQRSQNISDGRPAAMAQPSVAYSFCRLAENCFSENGQRGLVCR